VLDLPLGHTLLRQPAAVMVNLLGTHDGPAAPNIAGPMMVPGAHLHLYGKRDVRVRRKMGHITTLSTTLEHALLRARQAASEIAL
jgi:5-(carboxyamino)imidazole ribonucleotide synthase